MVANDHPYRVLDETGEAIVFNKLSELELGPKLYGCTFPGGRLEEFIQGRTFVDKDLEDEGLLKSVAKCLARMHSLDLPVGKEPKDALEISWILTKDFEANVRANVTKDHLSRFGDLFTFDYKSQIEWLRKIRPQVPTRTVLGHHDVNRSNLMVREKDRKVFLLDIEFSSWGYRGADLGSFFNNFMFDNTNMVDFRSHSAMTYPSETRRRTFIGHYLDEIAHLHPYELNASNDSIDAVFFESDYYSLVYAILFSIWFLRDYHMFGNVQGDPYLVSMVQIETHFLVLCL